MRMIGIATMVVASCCGTIAFAQSTAPTSAPATRPASPQPSMMVAAPDREDGLYATGDRVGWTVSLNTDVPFDDAVKAHWTIKRGGGETIASGDIEFPSEFDTARIEFLAPGPGTYYVAAKQIDSPRRALIVGAAVDVKQVKLNSQPPADFDAFWQAQLDASKRVPLDWKLEEFPSDTPGVRYYKGTARGIEGSTIHFQLARPDDDAKHPAVLIQQWAGVYPLQRGWVIDKAKLGLIAMNVMPHDLPIDRDETFYAEQRDGPLKNYFTFGNQSRESSYYRRMILSGVRAAEVLAQQPQWDGKSMVATGTSQGGYLTIATAGLSDRITALCANVPAGLDTLADEDGRASGFPYWHQWKDGKADAASVATSLYYDGAHFARRIKVPALVAAGAIDTTCPPWGVIGTANLMQGPTELIFMPLSDHQGDGGKHQEAYYEREHQWLQAISNGEEPPVK